MDISISQFRVQLETLLHGILDEASKQTLHVSDFMAVAALSRLVIVHIEAMTADDLTAVFGLVERAVATGDEEAKNAATTGFLENLQNRASSGAFPFEQVAPLLGPESKKYCEEWDKFTGMNTPGIGE